MITLHTLAIRFANVTSRFPIWSNKAKSFLLPWVTTFENGNNDYIKQVIKKQSDFGNIALGVIILLAVLFFSLFLFFPAVKVNLYFTLSNVSFLLFMILGYWQASYYGNAIWPGVLSGFFVLTYIMLFLFCLYKIFHKKVGWLYWVLFSLAYVNLLAGFFIDTRVSAFVLILVLADMLRICIRCLKTNRTAAFIMLVAVGIDMAYFIFVTLSQYSIVNIPELTLYEPLMYLVAPIGLAIYLGFDFGKTNQSLLQKVTEVELLSIENQKILSDQNEKLEKQVQERTSALRHFLETLKATQSQLIQSEKMASLGELTAGIAHEIQNPLNFVNNFSEVNKELLEELKDEAGKGNIEEVKAIANDVIENEEKINHHGRRADAIVKGMLQHSRSSKGVKEPTDINALCDEYLRLSYHGLRAKDKDFNATIKTDFDNTIGNIRIIPQDIGRVLLNLYNNAFYAVNEKQKAESKLNAGYKAFVSVQTKKINDKVEITVSDNGNGIPQNIVDKIFQPFFTTKPTGQGTGLGLSLSYNIIKAHGGTITVESAEGTGSVFVISLPLKE